MEVPDLGDMLINSSGALAIFIKFMMSAIALLGLYVIYTALYGAYKIVEEGAQSARYAARGNTPTPGGVGIKLLLGGLAVVPAATLWTAADSFVLGGDQTSADLLSYLGGTTGMTYCQRFAMAIHLIFMVVGLFALWSSVMVINDSASGFSQAGGYRKGAVYAFAGVICFFVTDIAEIVGETIGFTLGLNNVCTAIT